MAKSKNDSPDDHSTEPCPARALLSELQLAEKWTFLILHRLLDRSMRFNEIKRTVPGISQKVLTQSLRSLERNGLVIRKVIDTSPVAVEYTLTPLGRTLRNPMDVLYDWVIGHKDAIFAAQLRYNETREIAS